MEQQAAHQPGEEREPSQNIPAMDSGAQLLERMDHMVAAIKGMGREMDALTQTVSKMGHDMNTLNQTVTSMGREIDALSLKMVVMDKNSKARLSNSIVIYETTPLEPLYNVTTGLEISNCPETRAELEQCDADTTAAMLRELGEPVPPTYEEMTYYLKVAFGLLVEAVCSAEARMQARMEARMEARNMEDRQI